MKKIVALLFLMLLFIPLSAQNDSILAKKKIKNSATLLGIGSSNILDTYLSPISYQGLGIIIRHEEIIKTNLLNNKLNIQQMIDLHLSSLQNPSKTAQEYFGSLNYTISGFYPLYSQSNFNFSAGPDLQINFGGIYNTRNSNNPGSAIIDSHIGINTLATYQLKQYLFRLQLSTPLFGVLFSPDYMNSYYEIFQLGNKKNTIHFSTPFVHQALDAYFTVDIPIKSFVLRSGYAVQFTNTNINHLQTKMFNHFFMIGFVKETVRFSPKEVRNLNLNTAF